MNSDPKPGDSFAPEIVDERIEQLLQQHGQKHPDTILMHELQSLYREDADILMRARMRLFQDESGMQHTPSVIGQTRHEEKYTMNSKANGFFTKKHLSPYLLVAGLVVVLVVGSLLTILALGQPKSTHISNISSSSATQPPAPRPKTMQEVSTHNPRGVALDEKRGFVYIAEPACEPSLPCSSTSSASIEQHSLVDGQFIRTFKLPSGYSNPTFVAVNPADRHVWFTQTDSDAIGELDPDRGTWKQYKVAHGSAPCNLLFDQHGNIWFAEHNSNSIGFLDIKTHKIVETPTPTAKSQPYGMTSDPKGDIWFTENGEGISQIGMFTPTTDGKISIKETIIDATFHAQPYLITAAPNGSIWFSEGFQGSITEFDPGSNSVSRYYVARASRHTPDNYIYISGIGTDKQGNIWFTDSHNATIGYYIPAKNVVKLKQLHDPNAHPGEGLAVQSDGTIWFTEEIGSRMQGDPVQGPALVMLPVGSIDDQPTRPTSLPTPTPITPTVMPTPTPIPNRSVPTVAPRPTPTSRASGPVPTVAPAP